MTFTGKGAASNVSFSRSCTHVLNVVEDGYGACVLSRGLHRLQDTDVLGAVVRIPPQLDPNTLRKVCPTQHNTNTRNRKTTKTHTRNVAADLCKLALLRKTLPPSHKQADEQESNQLSRRTNNQRQVSNETCKQAKASKSNKFKQLSKPTKKGRKPTNRSDLPNYQPTDRLTDRPTDRAHRRANNKTAMDPHANKQMKNQSKE